MRWLAYTWGGLWGVPLGIFAAKAVETGQAQYVVAMLACITAAVVGVLAAACWQAYKELNEPMYCETCGETHV